MDYFEYDVEDFLMDKAFCNYCLRKEPKDVEFWEEWLRSHPEKREVVRQARELYFILNGNHTASQYEKDVAIFQQTFEQHLAVIKGERDVAGLGTGRWAGRRLLYAMSVALVIVAGVVMVRLGRSGLAVPPHLPLKSYAAASPAGERRTIHLPDGSTVLLNSASRMSVVAGFGDATREVNLEGEAYFDVARDMQHPFTIHTAGMDIHVLGTAFNVKAYPDDAVTEADLISGSVEVLVKDGANRRILLRPDEKISIPNPVRAAAPVLKSGGVPQKLHVLSIEKMIVWPSERLPAEVSWTMSCLNFTDKPLEEIAHQLERWYNVSIRFGDEPVKQYRYTATFDKKTIAQVLKALAISRPFVFYWEGEGKIVIRSSTMKN